MVRKHLVLVTAYPGYTGGILSKNANALKATQSVQGWSEESSISSDVMLQLDIDVVDPNQN
jgi:hypothetical protein